jgi:hypothetical protein
MLVPVLWGLVVGAMQAGSPLALRWLDPATIYALELALIAAVYIGFAVADGRPRVVAVESAVAGLFVLLAAIAVTGTAWLLVLGYTGHGLKDAWQQRRQYVTNTRWWPPFCAAVDWLVAAILVIAAIAGVHVNEAAQSSLAVGVRPSDRPGQAASKAPTEAPGGQSLPSRHRVPQVRRPIRYKRIAQPRTAVAPPIAGSAASHSTASWVAVSARQSL